MKLTKGKYFRYLDPNYQPRLVISTYFPKAKRLTKEEKFDFLRKMINQNTDKY